MEDEGVVLESVHENVPVKVWRKRYCWKTWVFGVLSNLQAATRNSREIAQEGERVEKTTTNLHFQES